MVLVAQLVVAEAGAMVPVVDTKRVNCAWAEAPININPANRSRASRNVADEKRNIIALGIEIVYAKDGYKPVIYPTH